MGRKKRKQHRRQGTRQPLQPRPSDQIVGGESNPLNGPPPTPEAIARALAGNATLWIYRELGMHKGKVPPPGWVPSDPVGRELHNLLTAKFLAEAEGVARGDRDSRYQNIESECKAWSARRYREQEVARRVGQLHGIAIEILFFTGAFGVIPTVVAAHEILRERETARPDAQALSQLEVLLDLFKIPIALRQAVLDHVRQRRVDDLTDLLSKFFALRVGYWSRFLDKDGRIRKRNLPNLPETRDLLVKALQDPERFTHLTGTYSEGLRLSARDARDLAARCVNAAYPEHSRTRSGESLRQNLLYHKRREARFLGVRSPHNLA